MRERLMALRKALDKETKEKEAVANKAVRDVHLLLPPLAEHSCIKAIEIVGAFFHKNPQAEAYFAIVDVEGNAKVLGPSHAELDTPETFSDSSGCCTSSEKTW
jgi:alanyl-tRNA synthetase